MNTLARAVAWQTRLLEQAVSDDGLTREDAERAFATLDQLAAVVAIDNPPPDARASIDALTGPNLFNQHGRFLSRFSDRQLLEIKERFERTAVARNIDRMRSTARIPGASATPLQSLPVVRAAMSATIDAALHASEMVVAIDQRIRICGPTTWPTGWFDLDAAIEPFCPPIILRQLHACEARFEETGGEAQSREIRDELAFIYSRPDDHFWTNWHPLWAESSGLLRPDEILILTLKHARDALYQVAANAVWALLRNGELDARSLGPPGTFGGWQTWPAAEWRRHRVAMVPADGRPGFEVISDDGSTRIRSDQFQLGSIIAHALSTPAVAPTPVEPPRTKRRASGGYAVSDAPLIQEMRDAIQRDPDLSPTAAASKVAKRAKGENTKESSKIERLVSRYYETFPSSEPRRVPPRTAETR